jgi:septum formation protein
MQNILLLGSKSPSRVMLLQEARIPFLVVPQNADESCCDVGLSLSDKVMNIALHKMSHVQLVFGTAEGERCFVLTADTMVCDARGVIHGKPIDRNDAVEKLRQKRKGATACTAFCLDKKTWNHGTWQTVQRTTKAVMVEYVFDVPDVWINTYFTVSPGLHCAGGAAVEQFGAQFLRSVNGSHSALIGLPMVELRESLEKMNFFSV